MRIIETPMAVALAVAFGDTARTFGADVVAVRKVLAALTGLAGPVHGPALKTMMSMCAEHVRGQLPPPLLVVDPPPCDGGEVADFAYLARIAHIYGPTIELQPFPNGGAT